MLDGMLEVLYLCIAAVGYVVVGGVGVAIYQWFERLFWNACGGTLDLFESQWGCYE